MINLIPLIQDLVGKKWLKVLPTFLPISYVNRLLVVIWETERRSIRRRQIHCVADNID